MEHHLKCANCSSKISCRSACTDNLCYDCCRKITSDKCKKITCGECNSKYYLQTHFGVEINVFINDICGSCYKIKINKEKLKRWTEYNTKNPYISCNKCNKYFRQSTLNKMDGKHCKKCYDDNARNEYITLLKKQNKSLKNEIALMRKKLSSMQNK